MAMTAPQFNIRPQQQRTAPKPKRDRYEEQIEKANASRKLHKEAKAEPAVPVQTIAMLYINDVAYLHRHIFDDTESLKDGFLTAMQLLNIDKNARSRLAGRAFTLAQASLDQVRDTMGNHPSVLKKIDELTLKLAAANGDLGVLIPHAFRNEIQAHIVRELQNKPKVTRQY